jgi:peptide deformylase
MKVLSLDGRVETVTRLQRVTVWMVDIDGKRTYGLSQVDALQLAQRAIGEFKRVRVEPHNIGRWL